jgi:hypothetical protein
VCKPASIDITIAAQVTPVFTAIGPLCVGATAPALPTLSNNGITGTWNPATISTAAAGTTTYTFTPDAGQCSTATATLDVTVTGAVTPTFDPVGNLCIGATAPVLPAVSNNGINGTWNPATISTAAAGTTTYTFTPDAGQCASPASIDITIAAQVTLYLQLLVRFALVQRLQRYLLYPITILPVHGTLQRSALQLPEPLPIPLRLMQVSVLRLLQLLM